VAAVDIDPEPLEETEAAVRATDGEITSFVADVAVEDQVRDAVEGAVERFGGLHVLYNNASVLWRDRDLSVLETASIRGSPTPRCRRYEPRTPRGSRPRPPRSRWVGSGPYGTS
jgi:NAD(P)-dependent dehydrogenase (short-subunit alcohol dehydrogenase family)